jgi:hypothetical protein
VKVSSLKLDLPYVPCVGKHVYVEGYSGSGQNRPHFMRVQAHPSCLFFQIKKNIKPLNKKQ